MLPDDPRHGQERGYFAHRKDGERPCDRCTIAHSAASKRRAMGAMNGRPALIPALGTQRRIRALAAIGWPFAEIAGHMGRKPRHEGIAKLLRQAWVRPSTAARVDRTFRALCMTPGPNDRVAKRAKRNGWAPPLAWDDIDDPSERPGPSIVPGMGMDPAAIAPSGRSPVATQCGTERGYQQHRQAWRTRQVGPWPLPEGDPCGCRSAHREYERDRTRRAA